MASHKRRSGKKKLNFSVGRYILGFIAIALAYHFAVSPTVKRIMLHPIFKLRHVVVDGSQYIDSEKIITSAAVEMGKNIFDINIGEISENLKKSYAAEDFTVYRSIPCTITIKIHEKKPVALLNMKKLIGVDKKGVPLPHIGANLVESLPIVTGINS
ncbi:MAG TPA: FtsQ-type POTRA domain-containing protein, partial [bacterium]|nr:FtsQ-type POTRA domain-containing protein [bacterium]